MGVRARCSLIRLTFAFLAVFCHNSSLAWAGDASKEFASLNVGDEVEFEYTDGERGVEAIKVTAVTQVLGRRRGTVTAFNDEKGYGFVADDDPETVGNKESELRSPHLLSQPSPSHPCSRLSLTTSHHQKSSFITGRSSQRLSARHSSSESAWNTVW